MNHNETTKTLTLVVTVTAIITAGRCSFCLTQYNMPYSHKYEETCLHLINILPAISYIGSRQLVRKVVLCE